LIPETWFSPRRIPFVPNAATKGRAIQFDNEFLARGTEVNHVISDSVLCPKMDALHAVRS
jgi:hypothetical protein